MTPSTYKPQEPRYSEVEQCHTVSNLEGSRNYPPQGPTPREMLHYTKHSIHGRKNSIKIKIIDSNSRPRQLAPARDLCGLQELATPRVRQAAKAALGGVRTPTLLTRTVAGVQDVGSHDRAAAAGADHHQSHSSAKTRDQLHCHRRRLRHLRRLRYHHRLRRLLHCHRLRYLRSHGHRRHHLHLHCRHRHLHSNLHSHRHPHSPRRLHLHLHRPRSRLQCPCPLCPC
ncbi:unnamed protein product [Closterium sp. NIES-53]